MAMQVETVFRQWCVVANNSLEQMTLADLMVFAADEILNPRVHERYTSFKAATPGPQAGLSLYQTNAAQTAAWKCLTSLLSMELKRVQNTQFVEKYSGYVWRFS